MTRDCIENGPNDNIIQDGSLGALSGGAVSWTIRPAMCSRRCNADIWGPARHVHTVGARTAFRVTRSL